MQLLHSLRGLQILLLQLFLLYFCPQIQAQFSKKSNVARAYARQQVLNSIDPEAENPNHNICLTNQLHQMVFGEQRLDQSFHEPSKKNLGSEEHTSCLEEPFLKTDFQTSATQNSLRDALNNEHTDKLKSFLASGLLYSPQEPFRGFDLDSERPSKPLLDYLAGKEQKPCLREVILRYLSESPHFDACPTTDRMLKLESWSQFKNDFFARKREVFSVAINTWSLEHLKLFLKICVDSDEAFHALADKDQENCRDLASWVESELLEDLLKRRLKAKVQIETISYSQKFGGWLFGSRGPKDLFATYYFRELNNEDQHTSDRSGVGFGASKRTRASILYRRLSMARDYLYHISLQRYLEKKKLTNERNFSLYQIVRYLWSPGMRDLGSLDLNGAQRLFMGSNGHLFRLSREGTVRDFSIALFLLNRTPCKQRVSVMNLFSSLIDLANLELNSACLVAHLDQELYAKMRVLLYSKYLTFEEHVSLSSRLSSDHAEIIGQLEAKGLNRTVHLLENYF